MKQNKPDISILIVTRNAQNYIGDSLSTISNQETEYAYEVIIIDSSSSDKTQEIVMSFPFVKLVVIKKEEFGHGKTRNMGVSLAKGEYLVFVNGDATPLDKFWLVSLIENFKDRKIAGVYSRQISRKRSYVCYTLEQEKIMGPIKLIKELNNLHADRKTMLELMRFSTVSCAIRKDIWENFKFNEKLPVAEDQEWAERVLNAGYKIAYEPKSIVYHSHNYTLKEKFLFYYNCTISFNKILNRKQYQNDALTKSIQLPGVLYLEFFSIINYCKKNKYSISMTIKEIIIAFLLRISGILANLSATIKSRI